MPRSFKLVAAESQGQKDEHDYPSKLGETLIQEWQICLRPLKSEAALMAPLTFPELFCIRCQLLRRLLPPMLAPRPLAGEIFNYMSSDT